MTTLDLSSVTLLRMVADTTRAFVEANTDVQHLLQTVVDRVAHVVGDLCSVALLSDDRLLLVPSALSDPDPVILALAHAAWKEPFALAPHPFLMSVLATGEPYLQATVDPETLPPRTPPGYFELVHRVRGRSFLVVALRLHGESLGALALIRHRSAGASYGDPELAVAQILADHAALAISNARLDAAERAAQAAAQHADAQLQETERSHQRFFNLSPLAKFIYEVASERILAVNDAALKLYGYSRDEFMAVPLADLRMTDDPVADAARLASLGDAVVVGRRRARRRGGAALDVEIWSNVATFDGKPARYVIVNDITERIDLGQARAAEAKFRGLLEGAPDAVVIVDDRGIIVLVNSQTEALFGHARADLIGQPIETLMPARDRARHLGHRAGYFVAPETRSMGAVLDLQGLRKDGTQVPVEVSLSPLQSDGGMLVMSTIRDVTQRKQVGTALAAANRELEAFSYSVAHDLRAPLRAINGFAEILGESCKDKLDEEGADCIDEILANSRRMAALIDALLGLARMSRSALRPRVADLSAMVRAVIDRLAVREPERAVEVVIEDGVCAEFDVPLVEALVDNLVTNAWKFTSKVARARIEFSAREHDGVRSYCITDNGAGFDMEFAASLFAPFQRLHSAQEFPGTGVGLATAQRIVHRHGGRIWADAAVGKGAAFQFTLAAAPGGAAH